MTRSQEFLLDPDLDAGRLQPAPEVDDLLVGAVDLHVLADDGALLPEARDVLDVLAAEEAILDCGHPLDNGVPADAVRAMVGGNARSLLAKGGA